MPETRKRARFVRDCSTKRRAALLTKFRHSEDESPEIVEKLLGSPDGSDAGSDSDSDCTDSLSKNAIVLPWWLKDRQPDRLRTFMEYRDDTGIMAIARVPSTAQWGKGALANKLVVDGRAVHLWVVGVLQEVSYVASSDATFTGCDVTVSLLRDTDRDALAMLGAKAHPRPVQRETTLFASSATVGMRSIRVFSEIYDATRAYTDTESMIRLSPTVLVVGDAVLVEANVVRRNLRPQQTSWTTWNVEFDLIRISRLIPRVLVKQERVGNGFPVTL